MNNLKITFEDIKHEKANSLMTLYVSKSLGSLFSLSCYREMMNNDLDRLTILINYGLAWNVSSGQQLAIFDMLKVNCNLF